MYLTYVFNIGLHGV